MKKVLFIINPIAGTGYRTINKASISKFLDQYPQFLFDVVYTKYSNHAREITRKEKGNYDIIVACGGDGTVKEIATELVFSNTQLLIIPIGSGNGLAHHLNIPFNISDALRKIASGKPLLIDVCIANGAGLHNAHFYSNCGFGYDAHVIHGYASTEKRGFLTYLYFLFKYAFNYTNDKAIITMNNHSEMYQPFVFTIANSSYYGYAIKAVPHALISDGLMDTLLVQDKSFFNVFCFLLSSLFKQYNMVKRYVQYDLSNNIKINFLQRTKLQLDGEPYFVEGELEIQIQKQSLKVLV